MNFYLGEEDSLMNKQNVALFCLLRDKETKRMLLVVNCHILFNKSRGDIKFAQVLIIMRGVRHILQLFGRIPSTRTK